MSTYRQIIEEIVPTHAIAEAERRVYDNPNGGGDTYRCADGRCALGVMLKTMLPKVDLVPRFPYPGEFPGAHEDTSPTVRRRRVALFTILRANDRGLLATPGSLTDLLDREFKVVIR